MKFQSTIVAILWTCGDAAFAADAQPSGSASPAAVRAQCVKVLADPKAGGYDKAQARLQIGKSYFDEQNYATAREEYSKTLQIRSHPFYMGEALLGIGHTYWQTRNLAAAGEAYTGVLKTEGARPEHQAAAKKRLDALDVLRRIRPTHPRLFFNDETWPAVKTRALAQEKDRLDEMKKSAAALPAEFPPQDWGNALMRTAFVYRVAPEAALLEKIKKMFRASLDFYEQVYARHADANPNRGAIREVWLGYPFTRIGWLAALDWVWNDLTVQDREELVPRMVTHVYGHLARFPVFRTWNMAFYNADNMYWYAGLALAGEGLRDTDYLHALALLEEGLADHQKMLKARGEARGDDGDFTSVQIEYTLAGDPHAEWHFLHTWQSAISREIPAPWQHSHLFPNYVLWNLLPGFHHYGLGFAWHTSNRVDVYTLHSHLAEYLHFYRKSHPELAALAHYLRDQLGKRGSCGRLAVDPIMWSNLDDLPPPKLPEHLPLTRHFEGSGTVFFRSGHAPQDTYALLSAGGGRYGSDHYDTGHFTIYKQGFLALDTGTRGATDHSGCYYPQSAAHNCVLIRMPDEKFLGEWAEPVAVNSAGQNRVPRFAKTLAFETGPQFSYAASDATTTYHPDKCGQMVRQFLFLPPDHFVVFDRVSSKKPEYAKTWLLHTANEPLVTDKQFRADQGQGRLFCRTLYPTDAVLTKIGGPGQEFWADNRNWPLDGGWRYWGKVVSENRGLPDRAIPETMGRWHIEVRPGNARNEDLFLHLIQVGDQTLGQMSPAQLDDSPEAIDLRLEANSRTYRIRLNKSGRVGGHIQIDQGRTAILDRDLTQAIMPQKGLATEKGPG